MLRRRVPSSTSEKLWSIGLRLRKEPCTQGRIFHVGPHRCWNAGPQARALTSGTTGLMKEQSKISSTTPLLSDATALVSAAKEAQRLSDLAAKSRPPKEKTTEETPPITNNKVVIIDVDEATIQNAIEAAQALLFVTRLSSPLQDAIQNRETASPEIQRQITSLHRAFLAVTSWCLDMVSISSNNNQDPLDMGLELARRAHQLQLPFHMPMYVRLMNTVAQYSEPKVNSTKNRTAVGEKVLEIAARAPSMLGPDAIQSCHIFREPLETLARRRRFGDVATILAGIENQYSNIMEIEKGTILRLLVTLEITLRKGDDVTDWEETAEVLEVLNLADPYLWKTVSSLNKLSDVWNRKRERQREQVKKALEEEAEEDSTPKLLPTRPSDSATAEVEGEASSSRRRRKRSVSSYQTKDELYLFRAWIYQGESPSEHDELPDVTSQIEALYDGKDFRYSEELERSILKQNMDEDDDALLNDDFAHVSIDSDDDSFFSDDDLYEVSDDSDDDGSDNDE